MKPYDVPKMLEQLKKVYIERVVHNGFEDGYLYNDELMKLNDVDLDNFKELKGIIGSTKAMPKSNDIDLNNQGFTNEEYEQAEDVNNKKRKSKELTDDDKKLLDERAKKQKQRQDAISILRGISIRMPLLIYGAELNDEDKEISIDNFAGLIDPQSWIEFMPKGITKQIFNTFKKYYDPEIFSAAGKRIRSMAKAADNLSIEERIERITTIFNTFRNPDKETVLTPWRVVNMHLGDCLGGYKFYDETNTNITEKPQYIDKGEVTKNVFNTESRVLEINSKSGLYPLYVAYSIYRSRLAAEQALYDSELSQEQKLDLWDLTVRDNVFVICKTQMAKSITKRTLVGFRNAKVNTRYFEDLINQITNKSQQFIEKVRNGKTYWKVNNDEYMKFNAIVGNPPYQVMDGGGKDTAATPIYNKFVSIAKTISPSYLSMIIPARWYSGGRGLDEFRSEMLADKHIRELYDFIDSRSCFPAVDIAGGVCYFLWDKSNKGTCLTTSIDKNNKKDTVSRNLNDYSIFIRQSQAVSIIEKVRLHSNEFLDSWIYNSNPFGFRSFFDGKDVPFDNSIPLFTSRGYTYVSRSDINQNAELIDKWKVIVSKTSAEHAGQSDNEGKKRILSRVMTLPPGKISSETYLLIKCFDNGTEADNLLSYIKTKFFRFLLSTVLLTQNIAKDKFCFVPTQELCKSWTDEELYKKYDLSTEEITFIESMIKPME